MSKNVRFRLLLIVIPVMFLLSCSTDRDCLTDRVDTLVGTDTDFTLSHGNVYPAVGSPHAMISWTPQTAQDRIIYKYRDDSIQGFRGTHQSSGWLGDYGSLSLMPMTGKLHVNLFERSSTFNHEQEAARPHFYRATLSDYGIQVRMTATDRCGFFQFQFPRSDDAIIIFEPSSGTCWFRIVPEEKRIVCVIPDGGGGNPKGFAAHFVIQVDTPFLSWGTFMNNSWHDLSRGGNNLAGVFIRFKTAQNQLVHVKIGTSFISDRHAALNVQREIPGWDFESARSHVNEIWNRELKRIDIRGGTQEQQEIFYTAMYHCLQFPRKAHEPDREGNPLHYSPYDGEIHKGVLYGGSGFWDTFRAQFPLLILLKPNTAGEIIRGLMNACQEGGWLPKWPSPGYRNVMTGTPADIVVADALVKGINGITPEAVYPALRKNAFREGDRGFEGRVGIRKYIRLGYVPADEVDHAVSRTLNFAYSDYAVARVARLAGRLDDYRTLISRALNYRQIYDFRTGFMRPRDSGGNWLEPFDPLEWGNGFCEGNAWHYLWSVQHDIPGLIRLLGGDNKFIDKLDRLLSQPSVVRKGSYAVAIHEMREMRKIGMGQYAHNNEPLHHVLYLYAYAGQSWKSQYWIRRVMKELYTPRPDGLCGDDDTGQLSAWYVFSALGFYPVCPGQPIYVIGSPLFGKATIHLSQGRTFIIEAPGNSEKNIYIQSVILNGKIYEKSWLKHSDIIKGGRLIFQMGPHPNFKWGSQLKNRPPSGFDQIKD